MGSVVDLLAFILIASILGAVGQLLRVIVGLKKKYDESFQNNTNLEIDFQRMKYSLIISFVTGGISGILAAISMTKIQIDKTIILTFIAAGYAGTDFIEGFMQKYTPPETIVPIVTPETNPGTNTNVDINVDISKNQNVNIDPGSGLITDMRTDQNNITDDK